MATKSMMNQFQENLKLFNSLKKSDIYRSELVEYTLEPQLGRKFSSMLTMLDIDPLKLDEFPDSVLQNIIDSLQDMNKNIEKQIQQSNSSFIDSIPEKLMYFNSRIDEIMIHKPLFTLANIGDVLLEDVQGIRKEYDEFKAKIEADSKVVRESATGQSLNQAQIDFTEGAKLNRKQAWLWGKLSIGTIAAFIGFAIFLMITGPGELAGIEIAYYTAIRITLFFALATIIAFCLKILRANLLLSERNAHKARLANNLKSLIAAAPENQVELVLSILIQEISSFGKTGLLQKEDDSISVFKNIVDTALKNRPPSS